MQDGKIDARPVTRLWVKLLLILSLGLNLAVLGLIAGLALRFQDGGGRLYGGQSAAAFGAPYVMALPARERRAILRAVGKEAGATLPDRAMRREMASETLRALRARPFDAARLERAATRQAEASVAAQRRTQALWVEAVSEMSDTERAAYADAVEDILRRVRRPDRRD